MTFSLLTLVAFSLYLASAATSGALLFLTAPAAPAAGALRLARLPRPLLVVGIAAHFAAIGAWCVSTGRSPFSGETGTLSVLAWAIAIAYGLFDRKAQLPAVGSICLLVACVALSRGILVGQGTLATDPLLQSRIISLHVLAILVSFALFAIAFGCAALYLIQGRYLKQAAGHPVFRRLPPLSTLDSAAFHSVAYALPLLTLGLAIGLVEALGGALGRPAHSWLTDPHILISLMAWGLYTFYLCARLAVGWRGVRLQYVLLAALPIALALYVVPATAHRFN